MTKNFRIVLAMLLIMFWLVSCSGGSYKITIGEIDALTNELKGEYQKFTGHYFKKIKLEEGESLSIVLSAETEKGELFANIIDSDGNTIETLHSGDSVTVLNPDNYKLQVEGDNHKGSFSLTWKKE